MDFDVIVVGGGPVGCAIARDVAAAGHRVLVLEEHHEIGVPVQCAGLISERTLEISRAPAGIVLNRLRGALVYAPGEKILRLEGEDVYALAVDRRVFDHSLAEQALRAGAQIFCDARVVTFTYVTGGIRVEGRNGNNQAQACSFSCRLLIGADGHNSLVARQMDLSRPRERVSMYAAEVLFPQDNGWLTQNLAQIFLGRDLAPGWFGWIFPTGGNRARVGVGASPLTGGNGTKPKPPRLLFEQLIARYPAIFEGMQVLQATGGTVPIGFLGRTYAERVLLAGDAAAHVKPISGGGIYLGLRAAQDCAATAVEALDARNFSAEFLSAYQHRWESSIGMEIHCGLKHRETFLQMEDKEMDFLIGFLNQPVWQKLILKYGDLDHHSRLAARLAFVPPWAARFLNEGLKTLLRGIRKVE